MGTVQTVVLSRSVAEIDVSEFVSDLVARLRTAFGLDLGTPAEDAKFAGEVSEDGFTVRRVVREGWHPTRVVVRGSFRPTDRGTFVRITARQSWPIVVFNWLLLASAVTGLCWGLTSDAWRGGWLSGALLAVVAAVNQRASHRRAARVAEEVRRLVTARQPKSAHPSAAPDPAGE